MLLSRNRLCLLVALIVISGILYNAIDRYFTTGLHFSFATGGERNLAHVLSPQHHINRAPTTIRHVWKITTGFRAPDGVRKKVYLINGQFPGPWIEARSGDDIEVDIYNWLTDEGVAIHWHGLWMRGANEMDGAVGLTQSPTGPSKSFTYKFHIAEAQSGSFWYHSHSELQRADGLYGGIVIHKPASSGVPSENEVHNYDQDVGLLIGDWYHRPSHEVQVYYEDFANAGNEPAPDSLLINGQGYFNCSLAVPARPLVCQKIMIPQLNLNINNTRLRLINTGAIVGFTISIAGYDMHLIEVDGGGEVSGGLGSSSIGVIYPGERVDIILGPNLHFDKSKMVMSIELDAENLRFRNFALTEIQHFPVTSLSDTGTRYGGPSMPTEALAPLDLARVAGPPRVTTGMPKTPSQTLVLYTKVEILGEFGNRPRGFINQSTWEAERLEKMPLLALDKTAWGNAFVPFVKTGEDRWVDIVLNNFDDRGHPFHLHGNDFFVLSVHEAGIGGYDEAYNPFDTARPPAGGPLNTMNPVRKDTIFIPAMGYAVLRFKADNEGLWFFHCHILWHQAVGMAMALHVGSD